MIRRAFTMRLKPESLAEYIYHHDNIWPELVAEIERAGIASITTFQRGLDLFLVSDIADEDAWDKLWNSEVHKRWAEVMQPLMHLRDDGIVDAGELSEVFHLATSNIRNGRGSLSYTLQKSESNMEFNAESPFVSSPLEQPIGIAPEPTPAAPSPAPAAKPGRKIAARRAKKKVVKKAGKKKKPVAKKKAKHKAAKKPAKKTATKKTKKVAKKKKKKRK